MPQEAKRSNSSRCLVVDGGEPLLQPELEEDQVPVAAGQDAVVHEQVAQIGHRARGGEPVQPLMGEGGLAPGKQA